MPASLAEWRDREAAALPAMARALHIEASTLERIVAGDVEPEPELLERIERLLSQSKECSPARHSLPGQARGGSGGAPEARARADGAPPCPASFSAWLARADDGEWQIEGLWDGQMIETWAMADARMLADQLTRLIAVHDAGPAGFAGAFP